MRRLPLLAAVVALAACTVQSSEPAPVGHSSAPVINGEVDTPVKYNSTILMQIDLGGGSGAGCTGTLISPHVVITARHCVSEYNESKRTFGADYLPSQFYIWYGTEPRGRQDNLVARVVHPPGMSIENNDIAILVLKDKATIDYAPIRLTKPPVKNETVAVAGYGLTNTDTGTPTELHKRYRRENLKIALVGPATTYGVGDKEIVLGESICQGDSGGPVYAQGTVALLAVTSRGGNGKSPTTAQPYLGCVGTNTFNLFTRVDGFADLINKTVAEVGEKIWEEGQPKPEQPTTPVPDPGALGAVCGIGADCASKICVEWDGSKVCSQACSDAAPCPSGFECNGGYCLKATATTDPGTDPGTTNPTPAATTTTTTTSCSVGVVGAGSSWGFLGLALGLAAVTRRRRA